MPQKSKNKELWYKLKPNDVTKLALDFSRSNSNEKQILDTLSEIGENLSDPEILKDCKNEIAIKFCTPLITKREKDCSEKAITKNIEILKKNFDGDLSKLEARLKAMEENPDEDENKIEAVKRFINQIKEQ